MQRRTSVAVAWLVAALVIALGAAGHRRRARPPARRARAAGADVGGRPGRRAPTSTRRRPTCGPSPRPSASSASDGRDGPRRAGRARHGRASAAAIDAGTAQLDVIDAAAARAPRRASRHPARRAGPDDALLRGDPRPLRRARRRRSAAVDPLRPAWERLAAGVVPAARADRSPAGPRRGRRRGDPARAAPATYRDAIARIDAASAELDAARTIRDRLAADGRRLDARRLDRPQRGLRRRPCATSGTPCAGRGGRVTDAVRDGGRAASGPRKEQLPPDARALVVILGRRRPRRPQPGGDRRSRRPAGELLDAADRAARSPRPSCPRAAAAPAVAGPAAG